MKPGQTVKHLHSGRIIKIVTVDEKGINPTKYSHMVTYDAFIEHVRPLTLWEKVKLIFKKD